MNIDGLVARGVIGLNRGVYEARRLQSRIGDLARPAPAPTGPDQSEPTTTPRRNILFITVDQQRYDALGVNGQQIASTPNIDGLGARGINYDRAHVQNVVCMPSRSTMLTGQHPRTHGVLANGTPLPEDSPSVAGLLRSGGYQTGLIGKAHFDPHLDLVQRFRENRLAADPLRGTWHGFEYVELSTHGPVVPQHYSVWLWKNHPDEVGGFAPVLTGEGGGDTGAPEVCHNPIAREHYHTDWVAERTIDWLAGRETDRPWFCWMSFPDPHHPWDPPYDEVNKRIDWRDVPLPENYPADVVEAEKLLSRKPSHWLDWYRGDYRNPEGGPTSFVPGEMTADQLREILAMVAVENELVDDAVGKVLAWLRTRGLAENTDVFYTSDHGDLGGDFGFVYKGPYHVDGLLRVPLIWSPAPSAGVAAAVVGDPVGLVDLAPTFCASAGIGVPDWMEGEVLPTTPDTNRERVLTTFDSQFARVGMHLRTIFRDDWLCTAYEASTTDRGGRFPIMWPLWTRNNSVIPEYDGSEGELYNCRADPQQRENRWDDPSVSTLQADLLDDLYAHLPEERRPPLRVEAPT